MGEQILIAGALLAVGLLASLVAGRLRIPGLLLLLAVGMIAGSDVTNWVPFGGSTEDYRLAREVGIIALALILFEGGLSAGLQEIRPVLGTAVSLALVGTLLTALVTGLAAAWLLGSSLLHGLLIGAVVASTDGAAVFAVLRGSTLRRRLARTLEGEAGLNDPVAVLLVLGFIAWIQQPDYGLPDMLALFARQLGIGLAVGVVAGRLGVLAFQRVSLASAGLYPVASLATLALAYGGADALEGSGFLAAYLAGLALGTAPIPARPTIIAFHEGLAWLAQLAMFLTLGLLVFPSRLDDVAVDGTVIALVLVFVARPVAVLAATALAGFDLRERVALGWAGLRGAVPVVLATFPVLAGTPGSEGLFDVVFFAVLLSTLLQGATFEPLAQRLRLTTSEPALPPSLVEVGTIRRLGADVVEHEVRPGDAAVGVRVRDLDLPRDALVSVLVRGGQALLPRGSTRLEAGDRLHVLVRREVATALPGLIERWRTGPLGAPARPRRPLVGRPPVFTARPWQPSDGAPDRPEAVLGIPVVETLRTRRDVPGALVVLADGRYAVTGPLLLVGAPAQLQWQLRRRLARAGSEAERAWWQEVIGACAI